MSARFRRLAALTMTAALLSVGAVACGGDAGDAEGEDPLMTEAPLMSE